MHMYHIFYMTYTVLLVFSCVFTVFSLQKHEFLVHVTKIYQNTHVPYIIHEKHCFASVFMCFQCVFTAETCTFGTYHIYIFKYICTIYSTWNALFCKCFHVFSLCFHCRNIYFWYISHVFIKIHMNHIFYMKCTVLLVFSCVFTAETCTFGTLYLYTKINMYHIFLMKSAVLLVFSCVFTVILLQKHVLLVHITYIYLNTYVQYILHEMLSFASVFKCFHYVFTAETFTFGTFHMNLPKYTCTIYST
jgi:hypothetical protein